MNPQMTDKPSKPASTKLELTWPGKQNRPRLEPRILLEDKALSYHAAPPAAADLVEQAEAGPTAFDDNLLIHGDNLLALKALESQYSGQVKCIYIDPPFNTGEAFEHYDDGVEHSQWLTLLRDRLQILHGLLSKEGSLFVHIDDNELAYLIVILDEIFGRSNRIGVMTFKQSSVSGPKAINPGVVTTCSYLVYYAKNKATWKPNRVFQGLRTRMTCVSPALVEKVVHTQHVMHTSCELARKRVYSRLLDGRHEWSGSEPDGETE